jgi:hypothetical protein
MYITDVEIIAYAKMIPADFSTGCAKCDADKWSLLIAYILQKGVDEGKLFRTGESRPCKKCGLPLPVTVHRNYYDPRDNVH